MQEQELKKLSIMRVLLMAGYGLTIAAFVACILLLLKNVQISLIVMNVTLLFYIFGMRSLDKRHDKTFAAANLRFGTAKELQNATVVWKGGLNKKTVATSRLLPIDEQSGGINATMCLSAQSEVYGVRLCELSCYYKLPQTAKRKVALLNGVWMDVAFQQATGVRLQLIAKDLLDASVCPDWYLHGGMHKITIVDEALADKYYLFGACEADDKRATYFLRQCAPLLQHIAQKGENAAIGLTNDRICAFFSGRAITIGVPLRETTTEKILSFNRFPELQMLQKQAAYWQHRIEDTR